MPRYTTESILINLMEIPQRVVSLVPSVTETLIEFDFNEKLVGVTDYCPPIMGLDKAPVKIGGTKSPNIQQIIELKPDLVIANQEENSREGVQALEEAGIIVWLTFPKTADHAIEDLWVTARIFHQERRLAPRIETLQRSLEWTRLAHREQSQGRYFCPIWVGEELEWWMTFNQDTYAHDILACCGGVNVFAQRERRYPLEADLGLQSAIEVNEEDTRYPRVSSDEVATALPDIILLPSEPYGFNKENTKRISKLLADTPAVKTKKIYFIDGRLIAWHGVHIAKAISDLPEYFQ